MKCDVCLEMLEEYLDGELNADESSQVAAHLITCPTCSTESAELAADQEMFSRYDRNLEVPTSMWGQIAEQAIAPSLVTSVAPLSLSERFAGLFRIPALRFSFGAVAALVIIAIVVGAMYVRSQRASKELNAVKGQLPTKVTPGQPEMPKLDQPEEHKPEVAVSSRRPKSKRSPVIAKMPIDHSDVVSTEYGYQDMDDSDTAMHLEQTQNLLRSIRNVSLNDNDQEIDVTYDKALSRRLLNENIVLRRDAEMKAKFPTKDLLSDLEPFLIDIANLPDHAKPNEVRVIKERVQRTEIVAALIGYEE